MMGFVVDEDWEFGKDKDFFSVHKNITHVARNLADEIFQKSKIIYFHCIEFLIEKRIP